MCREIVHRGPDDEGILTDGGCGIGMRRLSIIDLQTGHQPISNEDDTIHIVFNGEVYNFQELRDDLIARGHRFRTQTDTEAVLHCYEEYGIEGISRLRGMFGYAIWDSRKQQLLLARDRFGKKPLYYSVVPGEGIYFGSELKCLRAMGLTMDPDPDALRLYFAFTYVPDPKSIFRQVRKVLPGGWLQFSASGEVKEGRYWTLPPTAEQEPDGLTEAQSQEQIRELFDEAVRIRMIADVPLGAFLSGGVDSSAVVASMALHSPEPIKTFSVGFDEAAFNELSYAELVAKKYGTDHHTLIVRSDCIDLVSKLVHHFDEPFSDSSAIPTFLISEFAARHVKVVLSGDGGDEIFAGYDSFFKVKNLRRWDLLPHPVRSLFRSVAEALPLGAPGKGFLYGIGRETALERYFEFIYSSTTVNGPVFQPNYRQPLEETALRRAFGDNLLGNSYDILTQALYFEATAKLTGDMLVKVDRMSMANSLEVRSPMLDHKLAEFAARIPAEWKMRNGQGKYGFIQAMGDRLPEEVWNRPKRGFSVPIADWFRGPLREFLRDHLTSADFRRRDLVSHNFLENLLDEHDRGRRNHRSILWSLLMIELWFRHWSHASVPQPA